MIEFPRHLTFASALLGLSTAATAVELMDLPKEIAVPGATPVATFEAAGGQIYACAKNAKGSLEWTFREPIASLFHDGKTVGRHFAGPTWEFSDSSRVTAKLAAKTPPKTAKEIPWLKLTIVEPAKSGPAASATTVLRIDTRGGAFEGACSHEGELHVEPYAAKYVFTK
jgi:hypothetical protein